MLLVFKKDFANTNHSLDEINVYEDVLVMNLERSHRGSRVILRQVCFHHAIASNDETVNFFLDPQFQSEQLNPWWFDRRPIVSSVELSFPNVFQNFPGNSTLLFPLTDLHIQPSQSEFEELSEFEGQYIHPVPVRGTATHHLNLELGLIRDSTRIFSIAYKLNPKFLFPKTTYTDYLSNTSSDRLKFNSLYILVEIKQGVNDLVFDS